MLCLRAPARVFAFWVACAKILKALEQLYGARFRFSAQLSYGKLRIMNRLGSMFGIMYFFCSVPTQFCYESVRCIELRFANWT